MMINQFIYKNDVLLIDYAVEQNQTIMPFRIGITTKRDDVFIIIVTLIVIV